LSLKGARIEIAVEEEGKLKFLGSPTLFAFGDSQSVKEVHINESTWDQIALADWAGWHLEGGILFLCTPGRTQRQAHQRSDPARRQGLHLGTARQARRGRRTDP
jgi:hypothetical protein